MHIAILALQGAFLEHQQMVRKLGATTHFIRNPSDLALPCDGLILPGGESTSMGKMLHDFSMIEPLKSLIQSGTPVFGTCAGLILLAKNGSNNGFSALETMDIHAKRNAYGRQLGSFYADINIDNIGVFPGIFIRAPYIESVGQHVKVLASHQGKIVMAQDGKQLATSFHPELTDDVRIHQYFLSICDR
jgi:5'-phosphate synthase pdxT subunit